MTQNQSELLSRRTELMQQVEEIDRQLEALKEAEKADAVRQVKALMMEHGLSMSDLGSQKAGKGKSANAGRKVAPKYRNPQTGETWTGRGHKPTWLAQALEAGASLDSFMIDQPGS